MARRNYSFQELFLNSLEGAGQGAMQAGKLVGDTDRANAEGARAEAADGRAKEAHATTQKANQLDYDKAFREESLRNSLVTAASDRSKALEGTPTADGHAVDFQAVKGARKGFEQADANLWNYLNPNNPMSNQGLAEKRAADADAAEAKTNLPGAIGEDPDLSDTEKAFYGAYPEKYGDRLKPTPVTYLPGADGYVAAPTRGGGPVKKVVDEAGGAVKPQMRPAEKTTEQIEAEAAAKARGAASVPKALSAEDRQVVSMKVNSLKVARQQLEKVKEAAAAANASMLSGKGRGWVPTKENAAFEKAVAALKPTITAMTRIPGVGAMSDFETRLAMAPFPEPGEYGEVNDQAIKALEDLITQTEAGYSKLGAPEPAPASGGASGSVPVGTVKTNKQGMKVRKTATGWEPAE